MTTRAAPGHPGQSEVETTAAGARYEPVPGTPKAVLVDVDGTVALIGARSPFDESRVHEDQPNRPVIEIVRLMHQAGQRIVFITGRTTRCQAATTSWLREHAGVPFDGPYMRAAGDNRKDTLVKAELFEQHIRGRYDITCVLDDRDQVVAMWRSLGLNVLQAGEGGF